MQCEYLTLKMDLLIRFSCDVHHILQATVNRSKGNRTEISKADLIQKSSYCRVSGIHCSNRTIEV